MKTKPYKSTLIVALTLLFALGHEAVFAQAPKPVYTYLADFAILNTATVVLKGPARVISFGGRKGLNMMSIKSVLEAESAYNGPVYNFGRIAIRCMLHSKLVYRNLRVYNKATVKTEQIFK